MRSMTAWKISALVGLAVVAACSATPDKNVFGHGSGEGGSGDEDASTGQGGSSWGGGTGQGGFTMDVNVPTDVGGPGCNPTEPDFDKDGYTIADGDCNDCDPMTNPGAFDDGTITDGDGGPPIDTDCSGAPGGDEHECDTGLALDSNEAMDAAKAIGLCRTADENATGNKKTWGVISAKYVLADGTNAPKPMNALSHGILPNLGANGHPQQGTVMLGLSSGTARGPSMPGYQSVGGASMGTTCQPPIPNMDTPACPGVTTGEPNDAAALELRIRVPTNAKSFKFNLNFYTYEYPGYVCTMFNDFFVTLMEPKPPNSTDGNISFDQDNNAISVNNSMLQVCNPGSHGGKNFTCPLGTGLLDGTGFESHAATGWLQTASPVEPGSIVTLRWAIWDSGDEILDSTVLIDNFVFSVEPAQGATTEPVPVPK
jgi:hypothetical protein